MRQTGVRIGGWILAALATLGCHPRMSPSSVPLADLSVVERLAARKVRELYAMHRIGFQDAAAAFGQRSIVDIGRPPEQLRALLDELGARIVPDASCSETQAPACVDILVRIVPPRGRADSAIVVVHVRSLPPSFLVDHRFLFVRTSGEWAFIRELITRSAVVIPRPPIFGGLEAR